VSKSQRSSDRIADAALLRARKKLDEAIARTPDQPGLLVMRARAADRSEPPEVAASWWLRAADAHEGQPQEVDCAREAARCAEQAGDLLLAGAAWSRVLELEPTDAHRLGCGRCLHVLGDHDEARELLLQVADGSDHDLAGQACELLATFTPDPFPWARRGVEHAARAKQKPAFGRRLMQLSTLHREAGDLRKAEAYSERARPYLDGVARRAAGN
jgi:tetratricopeptide (TPR) repeat protein